MHSDDFLSQLQIFFPSKICQDLLTLLTYNRSKLLRATRELKERKTDKEEITDRQTDIMQEKLKEGSGSQRQK